eukprot:CAMPEP_0169216004 /NCGR_PEP_ID=MMETSP1016-20121227/18158_1 /TAXON_ID=342587 /ORGANISM="Karlodinium micrum, Strain CCMP2283" /LENGTH=214 /DNA_ID=CAMNT_0009293865 /DNA_START=91 /DNA_END=735 /DNA_ORIENTATION=+
MTGKLAYTFIVIATSSAHESQLRSEHKQSFLIGHSGGVVQKVETRQSNIEPGGDPLPDENPATICRFHLNHDGQYKLVSPNFSQTLAIRCCPSYDNLFHFVIKFTDDDGDIAVWDVRKPIEHAIHPSLVAQGKALTWKVELGSSQEGSQGGYLTAGRLAEFFPGFDGFQILTKPGVHISLVGGSIGSFESYRYLEVGSQSSSCEGVPETLSGWE